jgi:hypothetical protein
MKTNNKQQTAVEWFLIECGKYGDTAQIPDEVIKQAKEMDKQQKKGMYVEGSFAKMRYYDGLEYIDADQYYEQTYGGGDQ